MKSSNQSPVPAAPRDGRQARVRVRARLNRRSIGIGEQSFALFRVR